MVTCGLLPIEDFQDIMDMPVLWQAMDQTISCFCIILLFKWNQVLFDKVCCRGHDIQKQTESTLNMIHKRSSSKQKQKDKPKIILTQTISRTESQTETEVP